MEVWIRSPPTPSHHRRVPKEFLGRSLDTLQRSEIQLQPNGLFSGRLFEVLDSRLGPIFVPGGNIHFRVLDQ